MSKFNLIHEIANCDECGYERLFNADTDDVLLEGDNYHHKVHDRIRGALDVLDRLEIPYNLTEIDIECPYCCDNEEYAEEEDAGEE